MQLKVLILQSLSRGRSESCVPRKREKRKHDVAARDTSEGSEGMIDHGRYARASVTHTHSLSLSLSVCLYLSLSLSLSAARALSASRPPEFCSSGSRSLPCLPAVELLSYC